MRTGAVGIVFLLSLYGVIAAPVPKEKGVDESRAEVYFFGAYEQDRQRGKITVNVGQPGKPVILVLTAYEGVIWEINDPNKQVLRVIASGYKQPTVQGVGEKVKVDISSYTQKSKEYFYLYSPKDPQYARINDKVKSLTGKEITSFQGSYTGSEYSITKK
jgi:hypothetical protein